LQREISFVVNGAVIQNVVIDPDLDEDLRYFWRRFADLAERASHDNTGGRNRLEIRHVVKWPDFSSAKAD